jgi:rare lipoprotein A
MWGAVQKGLLVCVFAALAAACSTAPETSINIPGGGYKVGQPYEEQGVWYYPHEQADYDETGIASWYGPNFHGKSTANGERFDADGLTAAHRTLPMPVNVRVTNLENGRSLVLRVNDRGPFARGRIIDVSARAAELLGFRDEGTARVRVTYLARADLPGTSPSPAPPALAASTVAIAAAPTAAVQVASLDPVASAAPPSETLPADAAPEEPSPSPAALDAPAVTQLAVPAATQIYVQAGAFSARENAERLKDRLAQAGNPVISPIDRNGQLLYRVRLGPFDDVESADAALARLTGLGSSDAKIVVDR